jgi:Na+/glutamate symporter
LGTVGTVAGAIARGIAGATAGTIAGGEAGKAVDENLFDNYHCTSCGHKFSDY